MNTQNTLLSALLCCLCVPALAAGVDPAPGKVVKNAPYSAVGDQETRRDLADGNQITSKTSTLYYRDSNGNTRQETRGPNGDVQSVMIQTATDNAMYTLVPAAKLAIRISLERINARAAAAGAAAGAAIKAERKQGEDIVIKRAAPDSGYANIVPLVAGAYGDMKWAGKTVTQDLGARNIDGVKAEGKLRSYEIPAGEAGNRKPIVVADESWYSPELQMTLYSQHSDPRTGVAIFRLTNLKRGEPAAALFSVPSDYTINDVTDGPEKALGELEAQWKKK
ncbi:hypothetical protein [Duganella radicis]|uniref:DUF4412 domain-containing protein n=1 Tax=Duganella radicis TaxID=551988 RepID=A0A6L6PFV1_9BURK|nr:hypothetical protein [Duganella radicis]MTV37976.1 hypothetical protein [Duganella radicis]